MSDTSKKSARIPRSFNVDDASVQEALSAATPKPAKNTQAKSKPTAGPKKPKAFSPAKNFVPTDDLAAQRLTQEQADELTALTPPPLPSQHKRFRWSRLFFGAVAALVSLAFGLWVDGLIRSLFARQDWLGWLAIALTGLIVLSAIVIIARELLALRRIAKIDSTRAAASAAHESNNVKQAKALVADLINLQSASSINASGRSQMQSLSTEIMDGRDLVLLAERNLMGPLDAKARSLILGAAKRVSVVTAISPRAIVDVGYVLIENARLIRALSELYGGRPGTLGFFRLARTVVTHLAITGSIAVGEGLLQQVVGQGLAARLSTRLGEGVVNGLLTTLIGISAMDVCRPMPYLKLTRPSAGDFLSELTGITKNPEASKKP
ncbi:MAG: TIGR01620 family protein [Pseudomonadota bacterium]